MDCKSLEMRLCGLPRFSPPNPWGVQAGCQGPFFCAPSGRWWETGGYSHVSPQRSWEAQCRKSYIWRPCCPGVGKGLRDQGQSSCKCLPNLYPLLSFPPAPRPHGPVGRLAEGTFLSFTLLRRGWLWGPEVYIQKEGGRLCSASVLSHVRQSIFAKLWVFGCLPAINNVIDWEFASYLTGDQCIYPHPES